MHRNTTRALAALTAAFALAAPAMAGPEEDLKTFFNDYTKTFAAKDAAGVVSRYYRSARPMPDLAGMQASMKQLAAQGYDHSTANSAKPCLLSPTDAIVEFHYTRFLTSGQPMGAVDRVGLYVLHKYDDGWRISQILNMQPSVSIACTGQVK